MLALNIISVFFLGVCLIVIINLFSRRFVIWTVGRMQEESLGFGKMNLRDVHSINPKIALGKMIPISTNNLKLVLHKLKQGKMSRDFIKMMACFLAELNIQYRVQTYLLDTANFPPLKYMKMHNQLGDTVHALFINIKELEMLEEDWELLQFLLALCRYVKIAADNDLKSINFEEAFIVNFWALKQTFQKLPGSLVQFNQTIDEGIWQNMNGKVFVSFEGIKKIVEDILTEAKIRCEIYLSFSMSLLVYSIIKKFGQGEDQELSIYEDVVAYVNFLLQEKNRMN